MGVGEVVIVVVILERRIQTDKRNRVRYYLDWMFHTSQMIDHTTTLTLSFFEAILEGKDQRIIIDIPFFPPRF